MTLADDTTLVMRRTLKAPVTRVFRAWTDPALLRRWFMAGEDYTCTIAEADPRVGGRFRLAMRDPDGEEHCVTGEYRVVEPDRRLVFTWAWVSTPERQSLVTIELTPNGDTTEMTLTHERFADKATRDRHGDGWDACIDMFVRLVEAQD
jgi:uncharacterized protein YndB with AHSA1/START domain